MAEHFERLLKGLVSEPQAGVFRHEMLSDAELHQQLVQWNDTQSDYPSDKCIHELFEAQVSASPMHRRWCMSRVR